MGKTKDKKDKKKQRRNVSRAQMLIAKELQLQSKAKLQQLQQSLFPPSTSNPLTYAKQNMQADKLRVMGESQARLANQMFESQTQAQNIFDESQRKLGEAKSLEYKNKVAREIADINLQADKILEAVHDKSSKQLNFKYEAQTQSAIIKDKITNLTGTHVDLLSANPEYRKTLDDILTKLKMYDRGIAEQSNIVADKQQDKVISEKQLEMNRKQRELFDLQAQKEILKEQEKHIDQRIQEEYNLRIQEDATNKSKLKHEQQKELLKLDLEKRKLIEEQATNEAKIKHQEQLSELEKNSMTHRNEMRDRELKLLQKEFVNKQEREHVSALHKSKMTERKLDNETNMLHGRLAALQQNSSGYAKVDEINHIIEKKQRTISTLKERTSIAQTKCKEIIDNEIKLKKTQRDTFDAAIGLTDNVSKQLDHFDKLPTEDLFSYAYENKNDFEKRNLSLDNLNHLVLYPKYKYAESLGLVTNNPDHPYGYYIKPGEGLNEYGIAKPCIDQEKYDQFYMYKTEVSTQQDRLNDEKLYNDLMADFNLN